MNKKAKTNEEEAIQNFEENFGNRIQADLFGIVLNQHKKPIAEAQVSIGNLTIQTDKNGVFSFKNADAFEKFAYIKAFKEGYMKGSRI